jgi:tRNA1(Val) A37 N6-methylase TrmN6
MRRADFNSYIQESDFVTFFNELGWNHVSKSDRINPVTIDSTDYNIIPIADKQGFKILTCNISELPQHSVRKKIDTQLHRYFHNYILIFILEKSEHHLWVIPIKTVEKRDLVIVEYPDTGKADFLFGKMNDLSFDFDEETNIIDVTLRVHKAFEVNSAKITKDFYSGFRKQHTSFTEFIKGINVEGDRQWYASVMLNRLMFCYFIQKKGFLDFDEHYLRNKLDWTKKQKGNNQFFGTFYKGFLSHLFRGGLNSPNHDRDFEKIYGRIPYLNGGMFDEHELERQYRDIDIADDAFENLFNFFDKWCWHLDTCITATGKDINPDVLGYIFEQYINDRAQMGAYYTKEDITEYISKNCILPFLVDEVTKTSSKKHFTPGGFVWETLRNSGDNYIYDAVKKGTEINNIPGEIAVGLDTTGPNLLERRKEWNKPTPEAYGLPTEIWRETIERRNRYFELLNKIRNGEIIRINDFITYNLDIRRFVEDLLLKTDDHQFILHFYKALQNITILDPTCGSGAFLFAALNILEPLYEICISRMQEFNTQNTNLFKEQLEEIDNKYRSNIQHFTYKSIILRNLYGVDIMHEATEIARLRLFLKMVAVVDVDKRADNLGLDPLPDIDFNIRCGNTLIGYATEEELNKDLSFAKDIHEELSNQEFRKRIEDEMEIISRTYTHFKSIQLGQQEDITAFKQAKDELNARLKSLNEVLNQRLHKASSNLSYDEWLESHQSFHWIAEFYQIIKGNGGFDVIIGNPPYVEYSKVKDKYNLQNYISIECNNLWAYVIENTVKLIKINGMISFIVPMSLTSSKRMLPIQKILKNGRTSWISNYESGSNPGQLFVGVKQSLSILISKISIDTNLYCSKYLRFYHGERNNVFSKLNLQKNTNEKFIDYGFYKIGCKLQLNIMNKIFSHSPLLLQMSQSGNHKLYVHRIASYYIKCFDDAPFFRNDRDGEKKSEDYKEYYFLESGLPFVSIINSSIFYMYWQIFFDNFKAGRFCIEKFPINQIKDNKIIKDLSELSHLLMDDMKLKSERISVLYKKTGNVEYDNFFPRLSKRIIDEIDKVLAQHYGFSEEELDFIINYDIKYRMGNELTDEG